MHRTSAVPAEVWTALEHAETYEVLALDPASERSQRDYYNYRVIERVNVNDAQTRQAITTALRAGFHSANTSAVLACIFAPRHAVHAISAGREYDLVLCFHCSQAEVTATGAKLLSVSHDVQPLLDAVLEHAAATRPTR